MSVYAYRANNNNCRDEKLRIFWCNECGSFDLKNPRDSESDHRDVLRFTCNKCGYTPYYAHMGIFDVIKITKQNQEEIKREMCMQNNKDPDEYTFAIEIEDE